MEEIKENKSVVTSYRLSQDTKDKLQQQLKDLGMTQEQYFNRAVGIMELENVKQNSFLSKDTTVIQSNLDAILNAFISVADSSNNLIGNKDVELEALKNKYKDMLLDKESLITKQKQELQEVYSNLIVTQNENKEYENELLNIKLEHNKQIEQLEENLKDKNLIVDEYKCKNDDLLSIVAEYKQYKVEVEEYKKLLADSQARNIDLSNSIKDKDYTINHLNKSIEDLNESIQKLKQDNQKELEQLKKENQLNIKVAVAEAKEELNNNKEIETYQSKYKELLEELEKMRTAPKSTKKDNAAVKETK
jgi:DNA repair exonuclease SbcCD ATPase subunit